MRRYLVDGRLEGSCDGSCPFETYCREPLKCPGTFDAEG